MTQDEKWNARYGEVKDFIETHHKRPSKYSDEEKNMHNWWKHNKKLLNAGKLVGNRKSKFEMLLHLGEEYRRKNQYE